MSKFIILTAINESNKQEFKLLVNVDNIVYSYEENNLTCILFTNSNRKTVKETIKEIQLLIEE